jgi:hypothetical protein
MELRVFENRVLRKIFGPKRNEVAGDLKKMHNEEFHNVYSSPSKIRMMKAKSMKSVGHIARMGRRRMHIGCWRESQKKETLG